MRIALLLVFVAATVLRVHGLDRESIWLDEAFSISLARTDVATILLDTSQDYHPPLHYFLLFLWAHVAGDSTWWARLLSTIFSLGAMGGAWLVARRLAGAGTALVTTILLAVSVFHIEFAQEARMYTLLTALAALSTYGLIRLLDTGSLRWFLFFTAATALMTYTHVYALFVLGAQAASVFADLLRHRDTARETAGRWIAAMSLVFAVFLAWLPIFTWQIEAVQKGFWIAPPDWDGALGPFETYAGSETLAAVLVALAVFGAFSLARASPAAGRGRQPLFFLLPWLTGPIAFPYLLSLIGSPIFLPKYTIAASVPFSILAASGIMALRFTVLRILAVIGCVLLSWNTITHYYATPAKDGWREAVALVEAKAASDDLVLIYPYFNQLPFHYYQQRDDIVSRPFPLHRAPPPDDPWDVVMSRALRGGGDVWLVRLAADTTAEPVIAELRGRLEETSFEEIRRIAVHHFERRP